MPNLQVSLRNNNIVQLSIVGSTIQIDDYTNYITSTETGHLQADMTFKYISVRKYLDATRYEYCTVAGFDSLLSSPTLYLVSPEQTNYTFTDDALYEVEIIALPLYNVGTTYTNYHFVHSAGSIYKSLVNSNVGNAVSDTTKWELIGTTSDRTGFENISNKYRDVEYKEVVVSAHECAQELVYQLNCVILNIDCNYTDLCSNKVWLNTNLMIMIFSILPQMVIDQEYNKVTELINQLSLMCDCCS